MQSRYDAAVKITRLHESFRHPGGKIERNSRAIFRSSPDVESTVDLGMPLDRSLEVFISPKAETAAKKFVAAKFPEGFIFQHTRPVYHPAHNWDAASWVSENLPKLPVFEASSSKWPDINVAFALAREATHRVLSSSVFVHACDAMNATMDIVHYGKANPHGLPLNHSVIKVLHGNHQD